MIILLKNGISSIEKEKVQNLLKTNGYIVREIVGQKDTVLGAVGTAGLDPREIQILPGVESVIPISKPYKLASRELKKEDTIVSVGNVKIGGNRIVVMAGPCAVESREQIMSIAKEVREAGAVILRGGAFKPRTSPYAFQGLGEEGLKYLREAGDKYQMPVTTEVVNPSDVQMMTKYIDMFQIGARNMQNFELLKEVGKTGMPVLLKRGISATIEEWLMAAEYIMASGSDKVVLCERGIRTYEKATRNTLDVSAIPIVQKMTHLPVIGDPSHATGLRDMVSPMSLAILASGASGLIVEVHNHPEKAFSDGPQSLYPAQFEKLMRDVEALCPVIGKSIERVPVIKEKKKDEVINTPELDIDNLTIAFQGERGAFSEKAAKDSFGEEITLLPVESFRDVFKAVNQGKAAYGILPVENTLGGTVFEAIDQLSSFPSITVVGEQQVRIVHNLIVNPGTKIEDITHVYTHPQGLAQCKKFLNEELKHAQAVPFFDTAGSVSFVKKEGNKHFAAIAGTPAAEFNEMEILRSGIETDASNFTRFYVISREENAEIYRSQSKSNRASLTFSVSHEPGSLFRVLDEMAKCGLNLKKLESRPITGKPWEYSFFVEMEMEDEKNFVDSLEKVKECTESFRLIGTFTAAH